VTAEQIFEFFRRLAADNPAPETELESVNAYTLLVAVVLSAIPPVRRIPHSRVTNIAWIARWKAAGSSRWA
jgi:hypothetical protein